MPNLFLAFGMCIFSLGAQSDTINALCIDDLCIVLYDFGSNLNGHTILNNNNHNYEEVEELLPTLVTGQS